MADDKTAAERAAEARWPLFLTDPEHARYRNVFVAGAAWQAEQAVHRVAPDREPAKIAQAFHEAYERLAPTFGYQTRDESAVAWEAVPHRNKALMIATAADLLASGVLGVPAEHRTADRETIAKALQRSNRPENDMRNRDQREADEDASWPAYLALADAVLAVLVPADQVRAETLDTVADALDDVAFAGSANFLRARAAEYRKKVGA